MKHTKEVLQMKKEIESGLISELFFQYVKELTEETLTKERVNNYEKVAA